MMILGVPYELHFKRASIITLLIVATFSFAITVVHANPIASFQQPLDTISEIEGNLTYNGAVVDSFHFVCEQGSGYLTHNMSFAKVNDIDFDIGIDWDGDGTWDYNGTVTEDIYSFPWQWQMGNPINLNQTVSFTLWYYGDGVVTTGVNDGLELTMSIPKTYFTIGEIVTHTMTVRNIGPTTRTIRFWDSRRFDIQRAGPGNTSAFARFSWCQVYLFYINYLVLEPGESYTTLLHWDYNTTNKIGNPCNISLTEGPYEIWGEFVGEWDCENETDPWEFRHIVTAPLTIYASEGEVAYKAIRVETDRARYSDQSGEPVVISVDNVGKETVAFNYVCKIRIYNESGTVVYPGLDLCALSYLMPNQRELYVWDKTDYSTPGSSKPAAPGIYRVESYTLDGQLKPIDEALMYFRIEGGDTNYKALRILTDNARYVPGQPVVTTIENLCNATITFASKPGIAIMNETDGEVWPVDHTTPGDQISPGETQLWSWTQQYNNQTYLVPPMCHYVNASADTVGETIIHFRIFIQALHFPWDTNGDRYVGIDDIVAVAERFGKTPMLPDWDLIYDINDDDYVGIDDIVEVAEHFGDSY